MKNVIKTVALAAIASLALTGCFKHEPYGHRPGTDDGGDNGGRTEERLNLVKKTNWTVEYVGRDLDGLEKFKLNCAGATKVFPLIISPEDLNNVYGTKQGIDLLKFFEYEVNLLQQDAQGCNDADLPNYGVYPGKTTDVRFQRHMHGTWILYVPELDSKLNLTGNYAEYEFNIPEEVPTEAFSRWIGAYHVSDKYCGFDIEVSSADANYLYYVDFWETGPAVAQPMDGERDWLYARFGDGKLIFYNQFLQVEEYDGKNVDEVFAGTYLTTTSDNVGELDWQGVDYEDPIAYTATVGDKLTLQPTSIQFDNGLVVYYNSMRYSRLWFTDNGNTVNWAFYNTAGVPSLPMDMESIPSTRANGGAPVARKHTQATVHRDQLKPVKTDRVRKWTEK